MYASRRDSLNLESYRKVREYIEPMDICLVAGEGPVAREIQFWTQSDYSHWATAGWDGSVCMVSEAVQPETRKVSMSSRVEVFSGLIDVYRLKPDIRRLINKDAAWEWLTRASGYDYPEEMILHDWKCIVFGEDRVRHFPNSDDPRAHRVCSALGHAGLRIHGMPPMHEYDCCVWPKHGADPAWTNYQFTLTWP